MSDLSSTLLPERGVISVRGADAEKLLQGVITSDIEVLGQVGAALHTGLLSPQGKILFDFFVVRHADSFLIETRLDQVADLLKRLSMYKLRADVSIRDESNAYFVSVFWGDGVEAAVAQSDGIAFVDPRLPAMGARVIVPVGSDSAERLTAQGGAVPAYRAMRVALGVPEAGEDFRLGDTFPHEALYDQLGGVSFTKGCFVGQEVVSRMQHRGTARKRVVPVVGTGLLPEPGSEVRAGASLIGTLGSVSGNRALAMLRLDRAREAIGTGVALMAGETAVKLEIPKWATFGIDVTEEPEA